MSNKQPQNVDDFLKEVGKSFGTEMVFKLGQSPNQEMERLASGSLRLDEAMGGGYPKGRIIEIYGAESSGKTTLTIHAMAECQKEGGRVAFIDMEHAFDKKYAEALGVDTDELVFTQPDSGEQALELADRFISSGLFQLVIVDSVAALVPEKEAEGDMGDSQMGLHARLMSQALRKLSPKTKKNNCTVIFINQTRSKIGVMFGNPETTTGGNALKFYASVRLRTSRTGSGKDQSGELSSNLTKVEVKKNKTAPPFKIAEFEIEFGKGIDKTGELIDIACEVGAMEKSGSWYSYSGNKLGQGKPNVKSLLEDNPELVQEIITKVYELAVQE
jgi:recombination protein RecA